MKWLILMFMITSAATANRLISMGEIEELFIKHVRKELTESEDQTFHDIIEIFHKPMPSSVFEHDVSRMTFQCIFCTSAFAAVFDGVANGQTDEELSTGLTVLCTVLGIENQRVCQGALELNIPIITHIIRTTPEATPRTFCGLVMPESNDSNICPILDTRFEWQVELPDVPDVTTPSIDFNPLRIALLTDAHIDPLYEPFGVANCGEPTCCRKGQTPVNSSNSESNVDLSLIKKGLVDVNGETMLNLDVASEIRKMKSSLKSRSFERTNVQPAGYWGDYNCDSPYWAYDDVIERIASTHKDIDLVYYIGDSIDHGVWETTYELINEVNAHIVEKMAESFGNVRVVPVIGNHESQPTNQFAPSSVTGEGLNTTWLYEGLANKWDQYLTEEAKETLRERGEFSILARPGLRVISLNNNVAYRMNWWLVYDPSDSKKHLDWLIEELYKAELAGEKVHILAHIPPGVNDFTHTWTREYNRIVNRFSSTIAAEFNGHTHSDEFKIFYSLVNNEPINVAWGAGSTTSFTNYNLNYKVLTIESNTFEPTDIVSYVYNLTEANLTPHRRPHWFELYNVRRRFGINDLSASSMNHLVRSMVTDNTQLLDLFVAFFYKLSDTRWPLVPHCDDNCKIDILCRTVITVLWEREQCEELRSLFFST